MTLPGTCKYERNENPAGNGSNVEASVETYVCNECENKFSTKDGLIAHMNSHNLNDNDLDEKHETRNMCSICLKKFTAKKNLLKHLRDVHKNYSEAERMVIKKLKCPEKNCEFLCRMTRELRNHIEKSHKIKILKDTLQFPSEAVFQKWKKEEESNTVSWFVSGRKKTTLTDGTKKQIFYCHRTGHYSPKGFGKHRMRSVGSCKIGVNCPAAMEVTESAEGELTVIYYKTHLGHMQEVVYLKLTKEERDNLEEKIQQGFTFDSILEDIKESKDVNNEKKRRIHLLSKRDLYRIMYRSKKTGDRRSTNKELSFVNVETESVQFFVFTCRIFYVRKLKKNILTGQKTSLHQAQLGFSQHTTSPKSFKTEEKELQGKNVQPKRIEENLCQNLTFYPSHSSVISLQQPPTNTSPQQIGHKDLNISQTSTEGVASQIVILSPNVDCSSIPEIIFLSASDGVPAQVEAFPQNKLEPIQDHPEAHCSDTQIPIPGDILSDHLTKGNKSNLYLQLKEKIHKILEFLPHSEHLTPRQFDLINAKLDGILSIFNVANEKARMRKNNMRKGEVKRNQTLESIRNVDTGGNESIAPGNQGHYESSLIYAVYN